MAESKAKDPNDVSGMTAEERYQHLQKQHAERQKPKTTPHEMRVAARTKNV